MERNTIFALATASGKAGLAVVRVSGAAVADLCLRMCGSDILPRKPSLRTIRDGLTGEVLDECLVLRFEAGSSFTGEDVVEFHLHGSLSVVRAVEKSLSKETSLRLAEPGEFTRRALENGRLDLTQVEGLSDLIEAETEAQRLQALRAMDGDLSRKIERWRSKVIKALAYLETTIDFSEEDLPPQIVREVTELIDELISEFSVEVSGSHATEQIRNGFEVAIVGAPNVGKSTLLNRISGRDIAITSDKPGTTRDILEVRIELSGQNIVLLDTAGQRVGQDEIEEIGIERARSRAGSADLRVFLCENGWSENLGVPFVEGDIVAAAKADLDKGLIGIPVSGLTGAGVDDLLRAISAVLEKRVASASSLIRDRHRVGLSDAIKHLKSSKMLMLAEVVQEDFAAEELRLCLNALDKVIGRVDVEGLLDVVFSSFCIGK